MWLFFLLCRYELIILKIKQKQIYTDLSYFYSKSQVNISKSKYTNAYIVEH